VSLRTKIILILVSIIIVGAIIFSIFLNVQNCQHQAEVETLQRQILEQTNYAVEKIDINTSKIATIKTEKSISKDEVAEAIRAEIKKNKLDIVYDAQIKGQISLEKKLSGKSKTTQIVTHNKETIVTDPELIQQCNTCLASTRIKVPFDVTEGPWNVSGYTLTPLKLGDPGDYTLDIKVIKELVFELVLTQDKKGNWSTYIHSEDFDAENVKSVISMKPFKKKWYKKFEFPLSLMLTNKFDVSVVTGIYYKFLDHVSFGINGGIMFMNSKESQYRWHYGVGVVFNP